MSQTQAAKLSGFTLIEILVVVSIISVLAAILFPVFTRARESAQRASCLSNLKQLGLGTMMYVQDYDEIFPARVTGGKYWMELLQPYTKSYEVFVCPSSPSAPSSPDNISALRFYNYGANQRMFPQNFSGSASYNNPVSVAAIVSSSTTYLIMDAGSWSLQPKYAKDLTDGHFYLPGMGNVGSTCTGGTDAAATEDCKSGRHFGGINMAFADGHAKWLKANIPVQEARRCSDNMCADDGDFSAWNPLLDNS